MKKWEPIYPPTYVKDSRRERSKLKLAKGYKKLLAMEAKRLKAGIDVCDFIKRLAKETVQK